MVIFKLLLMPFAVIYDLITRIRNHLYDIHHKRSFRFESMVIGVGNLKAGGSGKTPMVEYLIRLLQNEHHVATLSRGYGRRTKGTRIASAGETADTIGDEPYQMALKFGDKIKVAVGEERIVAIPEILHRFPDTDVIVLDDAFQHRAVVPQLSILLTEYNTPFYTDHLLPAGRLRESRVGAHRADVIVVTKCPAALDEKVTNSMSLSIRPYAGDKPVFFSGLSYDTPRPFKADTRFHHQVILVSGIANAGLLEEYVRTKFTLAHHFRFDDHHDYTKGDVSKIIDMHMKLGMLTTVLTTEKDMVKLIALVDQQDFPQIPWFYLPVRMVFLKNGSDFDNLIVREINSKNKKRV